MARARGRHGTAAQDAQRALARDYEGLKAETVGTVAAKLRAASLNVPEADLDGYYNQAWHALYDRLAAGVEIASTVGFLVEVSYRRALDDVRRMRPREHSDLDAADHAAVDDDLADRLDDRRRLRELVEGLRSELGERERIAASLCYLHGYTRPQAAEAMGLRPSRMKKVMDEVSKTLGRLTREIEAGTRCEARVSTTKAYALGLLDPDGPRFAEARAHIDDCPGCRADVLRMRGLAVAAPAPLLPWAVALAGGAAVGGGAADKPRRPRRPRRPPTSAVAGAAAVVVAAGAAWAVGREGEPDERAAVVAPPPVSAPAAARTQGATAPAVKSPAQATAEAEAKVAAERKARAKARASAAARKRRDAAAAATAAQAPAPAAAPAAPTPVAPVAPVPTPAPAPTPAPTTAAPAAPAIDESGTQEFGVER